MGKGLQRTVLVVLFLVGLAVFSYPYAQGFLVKREMKSTVQTFQEQKETQSTTSVGYLRSEGEVIIHSLMPDG